VSISPTPYLPKTVALTDFLEVSRARTLDGLKITSSNLGKLPGGWIDDQVRQFYERTFPKEMEAMRQRQTRVNVPTRRPQKTLQEMWERPSKEAEKETKVEVKEEAQVSIADVPFPVRAAVRF
jgi:actin-related protein